LLNLLQQIIELPSSSQIIHRKSHTERPKSPLPSSSSLSPSPSRALTAGGDGDGSGSEWEIEGENEGEDGGTQVLPAIVKLHDLKVCFFFSLLFSHRLPFPPTGIHHHKLNSHPQNANIRFMVTLLFMWLFKT
jgi:hypothetical protein